MSFLLMPNPIAARRLFLGQSGLVPFRRRGGSAGRQTGTRRESRRGQRRRRTDPRHCGLFGRLAGSVPGFDYSPAMKNSKITWNDKTLNVFLAKPLALVPGSSMTYDGLPDAQERSDLIAYLQRATRTAECGPPR